LSREFFDSLVLSLAPASIQPDAGPKHLNPSQFKSVTTDMRPEYQAFASAAMPQLVL
jgi:hypothetical protein